MVEAAAARYDSLAGRVVVITGGASGIGATMVEAFVTQGCRVHFLDVQTKEGQALASQLAAARFHDCDLRDIDALRRTIAAIEADTGEIDVLINNAGNDDRHDMFAIEPDYWRDRMATNLDHQFFVSQAVARGMKARGRGSIILMSSTSWLRGRPGMAAYTAAKAAVVGLTRTLARELGEDGVRINCIVPGAIATERQTELWLTPDVEREVMNAQALKLRLDAGHVARMALFLASEEAGACTGAQFVVDAGLS
ncbi:SDR family NAD(P)-dependent oxidoreductase [Stakelama saccharophila]|uniref:SDR family oxidoreductase n=1 Tax=Stakelama saccharophila TaxID=3075605 RepID=A0ABZ0B5G9_9SPHN|nr:SDR family oxidoreductase [Stakelama sp. W311]WNO52426.1 SDR family oxidoreductase [Stakelama sp. W311]